jgi:hypothetical protein
MYHVYTISSPDGQDNYHGTTRDFYARLYRHEYRFRGGSGSHYYVYEKLREKVTSIYKCKYRIVASFPTKLEAREFEQKLIEQNGNLNTANAIA